MLRRPPQDWQTPAALATIWQSFTRSPRGPAGNRPALGLRWASTLEAPRKRVVGRPLLAVALSVAACNAVAAAPVAQENDAPPADGPAAEPWYALGSEPATPRLLPTGEPAPGNVMSRAAPSNRP